MCEISSGHPISDVPLEDVSFTIGNSSITQFIPQDFYGKTQGIFITPIDFPNVLSVIGGLIFLIGPKLADVSVALPAEPRGEKKLFFVQILGGEKLLKFGEKWAVKIF